MYQQLRTYLDKWNEVADERHVRVGDVAVVVEQFLPSQQEDLADADLSEGQFGSVRANTEITPAGVLGRTRAWKLNCSGVSTRLAAVEADEAASRAGG